MEQFLEFGRGPLFRFCFVIMLLGLIRIFSLDMWAACKAYKKAGDKKMPWKLIISRTWEWFFPVKRLTNNFHIFSVLSILFHIGLIIVPLFLFAHIQLWMESTGISWAALPYNWAFWLTTGTIICIILMLAGRVFFKATKALSKGQDYLWLILLLIPFVTGFICANFNISARSYLIILLVHVLSADLILILIPFSKIAHCVLMPLSQLISALAWKFPPRTNDDICEALNRKGTSI